MLATRRLVAMLMIPSVPLVLVAAAVAARALQPDADGDGLDDVTERALGTNPKAADTDGDGLADEAELMGVAGEPLLDLPAFGADPTVPDLMVQADWITCDPIIEYCGPNNTFDQHRMSAEAAERLARYFAPDVRVHVDNGVAARGDSTTHGNWGGARRIPRPPPRCNADSLGVRYGYFHRVLTSPLGSGGGGDLYGFCSGGDAVRMGVIAQELGHNLGMDHGGNKDSYPANCKPHYRSPMNYAYTYDRELHQFSRGRFAGLALNPARMDESLGLGTSDPEVLAYLRASPFSLSVRDDGAVDWNRDGRIDTTPVRAALTWAWASCEQSVPHTDLMAGPTADPVLAWLPDASLPRLYLIARRADDNRLETRFATRFDRCDLRNEPESCTNFEPEPGVRGAPLPGAPAARGAPAAVGYIDTAGQARLMVVYADTAGRPWAQTLAITNGRETWSDPAPIDDMLLAGDPALAVASDGNEGSLVLIAPVPNSQTDSQTNSQTRSTRTRLMRWDYDLASATWRRDEEQRWNDGTRIEACTSLALARGYQRDVPGEQLYAAIPTGPTCILHFARLDTESGLWISHGEASWSGEPPMTGGRPGLAYMPFERSTGPAIPEDGRFYIAWRPFPSGATLISMTEGNDPAPTATERRLRFFRGTFLRNVWAVTMDGISLIADPRPGGNLRATWVFKDQRAQFHPFADGIIDVDMRDQDDYSIIRRFLACSLTRSCTP